VRGGTGDPRQIDVEHPHRDPGIPRGRRGETDGCHLRLAEHDLRHGPVIGRRDMRTPGGVVDDAPRARAAMTSPAARAWYLP
jgi:hypothetical protein